MNCGTRPVRGRESRNPDIVAAVTPAERRLMRASAGPGGDQQGRLLGQRVLDPPLGQNVTNLRRHRSSPIA